MQRIYSTLEPQVAGLVEGNPMDAWSCIAPEGALRTFVGMMDARSPVDGRVSLATIESVLRAYGKGIGPDEFAGQLDLVMRRRVAGDARALSAPERSMLTEIGVPIADLDRPGPTVVDEAAGLLEENARALTTEEVAGVAGRSTTRIRGAIADGSLYGFKVGSTWLLPRWQFAEAARPLPHLRKVLAAIPDGTSGITMHRLMTQPTDELFLDGRSTSPRDWLLAGGIPGPVVEMVAQLYAW